MYDNDDDRARRSNNSTTIFNNQVKVILFLLTVGTGVMTIWEKCASLRHTVTIGTAKGGAEDSASQPGSSHRLTTSTLAHRHRPKTDAKPLTDEVDPAGRETSAGKGAESVVKTAPRVASPLQTTEAEDIEFKLLSAEGSSRAQTIRMTVVLTNHAANRFIWSDVQWK
ncbi:hypothetical protein [Puia dinghuensis]|uniref:Uncharacterized protein n=1 Tax=Puia dinghuensis TaxID=1792502 RepID=A0A8J2XUJ1_9BACT|nr:hypothetical protein [Puia dinghuensis]GGB26327.1 hypothetical protein GCM10011511_57860 [Puia dinghuensis]